MAPAYIKTLLHDTDIEYVEGEIETAYQNQVEDVGEIQSFAVDRI